MDKNVELTVTSLMVMNNIDSLMDELKLRLRNFKQRKSVSVWNFSCPICGDSTKNKRKARGFIYNKNGQYNMTCKNCNAGYSLANFIKIYFNDLYAPFFFIPALKQTNTSLFIDTPNTEPPVILTSTQFPFFIPYYNSDVACKFIDNRRIPRNKLKEVFYIDDINNLIEQYEHLGYTALKYKSSRLVFVIRSYNNEIIGFITRALNKNDKIRYYNIKCLQLPLIYGMPFLNRKERVWIVEGLIDSLFLPNALSANSSSFNHVIDFCKEQNINDFVCVYDNEPHNNQITKIIEQTINNNYSTVIFSSFPYSGKDINEIVVKNALSPEQVLKLLEERVYSSLRAKLEYSKWKAGY